MGIEQDIEAILKAPEQMTIDEVETKLRDLLEREAKQIEVLKQLIEMIHVQAGLRSNQYFLH